MTIKPKKLTAEHAVLLIFAAATLLRLAFVLHNTIADMQHDVYYIGAGSGHIGYIEYLLKNGALPNFDPTSVDQFYHPPLHHALAALWARFNMLLGVGYEQAFENIQLLTFFYSVVILITSYEIFHELRLRGGGLVIASAAVAFSPTFIILSGSINNDELCVMFTLLAALFTLRWYKSPTFSRIIKIALAVALAVLSKSSGLLVAPAIAAVFLYTLIKKKELRTQLFWQFVVFAVCCIPLALSWTVYCGVAYSIAPGYVPRLAEDSWLYIGDHSAWQRLEPARALLPQSCFVELGEAGACEYNIPSAILKTAVFGEFTLFPEGWRRIICLALYYVNLALVLISLAGSVYCLVRKAAPFCFRLFLSVLWLTFMVSFTVFCFKYPHTCTMNIRYIVPAITVGAAALGGLYSGAKPASYTRALTASAVTVFCVLSAGVYICYSFGI